MTGKGSRPRPIPDRDRYAAEFDRIFGKRKTKDYQRDKEEKQKKGNGRGT